MSAGWFIFGAIMVVFDGMIALSLLITNSPIWTLPARAKPEVVDGQTGAWMIVILIAHLVLAIRHLALTVGKPDA